MAEAPVRPSADGARLGPVALACAALPLLWLLAMFAFTLPERVRLAVGNWSTVVPVAIAALFAARIARLGHLESRLRRGWALIAFALAADACGFFAFGWYEAVLGLDPTYNWVNLPFYVYFIAMFAGLVLLTPPSQTRAERPLYTLDVLAVGLAGAMLLLEFVVHAILDDTSAPHTLLQVLTLAAYPLLGALTLFGVASLMMRLPEGSERRPYQLLCAAVALYLLADSAWSILALLGDYQTGSISDLAWLLGACVFVAATEMAWRSMRERSFIRGTYLSREFTRLMPYLAIATGMCVLLAGILTEARDLVPLAVLGIALAATVFFRQWLVARSQRDRALADSHDLAERRLAALVERSNEVIVVLGADLRIRYASPGASRRFASALREGAALVDAIHPADQFRARAAFDEVRRSPAATVTLEWRLSRGDEAWVACENTLSNLLEDGAVRGIVVNARDISERLELEERLRYQALHDPLTGVANRDLFIDRLMQALVRRKRQGGAVAVLFVDLDHFKLINDSLGHLAGDHLLRLAGQRLLETVRVVDTVARFGGDEFAVLLEDAGAHNEVIGVAGRVLHAMSTPLLVDARPTVVGASIGVAFAQDGDSAESLMRNADLAVYKAKSGGRGRVAVYEPEMQQAVGTRLELHQALRRALARDEFGLHYQPIIALGDGAVIGVEALLRWSGEGQALATAEIIAAAEEAGLIDTLGRLVLVHALRDAVKLAAELDAPALLLTVNVSVLQLEDPAFVRDLAAMLVANGWPAERLVLEFDERIGQRRSDSLRPVLLQLKDLGVRLSVDNFGIGETALAMVERLPFDTLKISRAFVARLGAPNDRTAHALTEALVGLGRALAMTTIAHGVENARQSERLGALGCRFAQGYHLVRPMPLDDLLRWAGESQGGGR
jgi:diguanylate cyclase (GGDEF)-like protein/PAS domain S-box-containing protein